jgi:hypothetical protein
MLDFFAISNDNSQPFSDSEQALLAVRDLPNATIKQNSNSIKAINSL